MNQAADYPAVSIARLTALRAYYALMTIGCFTTFWPDLLSHSHVWGLESGAQYSLLAALGPLALIGLRYPLMMLPIILFEFLWKTLWFLLVVAPLYRAGEMTELMWENAFACAIAIIVTPIVMPWRYFWQRYVVAPAEPWR